MSEHYRTRWIDRLRRRVANRYYPLSGGGVFVIGPDCFADLDATVVCWQGENYYRPGHEPTPLACWEKQLIHEPFEQFTCALPTGHDGPCREDAET